MASVDFFTNALGVNPRHYTTYKKRKPKTFYRAAKRRTKKYSAMVKAQAKLLDKSEVAVA
jgi:hypothetical protein